MAFTQLTAPFRAVLIGAGGGLGQGFLRHLLHDPGLGQLIATTRHSDIPAHHPKLIKTRLDLEDETSIAATAGHIGKDGAPDLVIVASGLLHDPESGLMPEKSLRDLSAEKFARLFAVNTIGPALVAKHFLPLLPRDRRAIFAIISARVGSISDNRLGGWYAYRASKAAVNMVAKNAAIELGRRHKNAVIATLQPGTVDTALSKPFQGQVPDGGLFAPDQSAGKLLDVLDRLVPAQSGGFFDHGGNAIAF